ncbi:MAG: D-alanyl-D-alanine carboxypeptidase [Defluviitaleaceae bacterium]|nr:D-alanyl-D-alanine carboxypeptidase [Defluviitaleaceae bacterium]
MKKSRILSFLLAIVMALPFFAVQTQANALPQIHAETFVLIEANNGRVLTESGMHRRMFPAATTMVLTSILAYEHLNMGEIFFAGSEVGNLPFGSARNHHEIGEAILGENLIRGMLIGAGLDTANIVALNVARRVSGDFEMPFSEAQVFFTAMMAERASDLGALDSRFINPHGYHHDNHFTTAYDLGRIAYHAMSIPLIAQIASEAHFSGSMAGADPPYGVAHRNRTWNNANLLIRPDSEWFYDYATGLRTGHTSIAGDTLISTAYRDGITLIAVTLNSVRLEDDSQTRWQDAANLFEYGFNNFAYRTILAVDGMLGQMPVYNPRLGDYDYLEYYNTRGIDLFLSQAEFDRLETSIDFMEEFVIFDEYDPYAEKMFSAPIEEGQIIGTISHTLDGELMFHTNLYASREVLVRDTGSDIDYHMANFQRIFFSSQSIPYWIAGLSVLGLLLVVFFQIRRKIRDNRSRHSRYKMKF